MAEAPLAPDSSLPLLLGSTAASSGPSPLEEEVVALFTQFRSPLHRYISSLGLMTADGEEVIQEVFLALYQHLRMGKPRSNLRGWIFRVGHNLALKQRTRLGLRSRTHCGEEAALEARAPEADPEEQLVRLQRQERLLAVVRDLPETDRCCLTLRAEGLRYREIAGVLGISLGGVSLSLARSLARLHRADERLS